MPSLCCSARCAGSVDHEQQLLDARRKDVDERQRVGQHPLPVHVPGFALRIDAAEVERGRRPHGVHPLEQSSQLFTVVGVHLAHQWGVAEVEHTRPGERAIGDVIGAEGPVGAGAVQEGAVDAGRADRDRVAGHVALRHDDLARQVALQLRESVEDRLPEEVRADLRHEPHGHAEAVQGDAGVEDRAAGRDQRRSDDVQTAGFVGHRPGQLRVDVERDVPGDHRVRSGG